MTIGPLQTFEQRYPVHIALAIQWGDMDAYQHLNNVTYFRFFENVRLAFFEKTEINEYMTAHNVGPILGQTECKYFLPLTWPDTVTIGTRIIALREKRFTMEYAVFSHGQNKMAAKGSGEIIYVDYNQNLTVPIPEHIVSAVSPYMSESSTADSENK